MNRIFQIALLSAGTVLGLLSLFLGVGTFSTAAGYKAGFSAGYITPLLFLVLAGLLLFLSIRWGKKRELRALAVTFLVGSLFFLVFGARQISNVMFTFPEPAQSMLENMAVSRAHTLGESPVIDSSLVRQFRIASFIMILGYMGIAAALIFVSLKWIKERPLVAVVEASGDLK